MLSFFTLVFLVAINAVYGNADKKIPNGAVVYSHTAKGDLPKNFRTYYHNSLLQEPQSNMRLSGSGQGTEQQMKNLIVWIRSIVQDPQSPIYIIDLRHEPHGFVNGKAVTWWDENVWDQFAPNLLIQEKFQKDWLNALNQSETITIYHYKKNNSKHLYAESMEEELSNFSTKTEKEIITEMDAVYLRIPLFDHKKPTIEGVNFLKSFLKGLPQNAWVHFHCHGGKGRTTTFMALTDMFLNPGQPLDTILSRNHAVGGIDLKKITSGAKSWKADDAKRRYAFIQEVYQDNKKEH